MTGPIQKAGKNTNPNEEKNNAPLDPFTPESKMFFTNFKTTLKKKKERENKSQLRNHDCVGKNFCKLNKS